jgi:hypothetical protein
MDSQTEHRFEEWRRLNQSLHDLMQLLFEDFSSLNAQSLDFPASSIGVRLNTSVSTATIRSMSSQLAVDATQKLQNITLTYQSWTTPRLPVDVLHTHTFFVVIAVVVGSNNQTTFVTLIVVFCPGPSIALMP